VRLVNKVIIVGRLTKDPEIRYTQTGKVVATFGIAVDKYTGTDKKEADFFTCVYWGKVAEVIGDNIDKGRKVLVEGRLQTRSYEDKQGVKRWVIEIVGQTIEFLDYKDSNKTGPAVSSMSDSDFGPEIFPDDDVPF